MWGCVCGCVRGAPDGGGQGCDHSQETIVFIKRHSWIVAPMGALQGRKRLAADGYRNEPNLRPRFSSPILGGSRKCDSVDPLLPPQRLARHDGGPLNCSYTTRQSMKVLKTVDTHLCASHMTQSWPPGILQTLLWTHTQNKGEAGGAAIQPSDATVPRVSCRNRGAEASPKGSQGCHKECKGMDQIRRTGK